MNKDNIKKKKLNELEKLYEFTNKFRTKGTENGCTHTMSFIPYGSYYIPDELESVFHELYAKAVMAGYTPHISERHKEYGPIVIDFDFVQSNENKNRYYTLDTIKNIIKTYNTVIEQFLNVSNIDVVAYILEKKKPTLRAGKYHDGLHIVYPYLCTVPSIQFFMRNKFITLAKKKKIFEEIPLVNDLDDVFDKNVINQSWIMYGSSKNKDSLPYYMTHIFMKTFNDIYDLNVLETKMHNEKNIPFFINIHSCRRFKKKDQLTDVNCDATVTDYPESYGNSKNKKKKKQDSHDDHNYVKYNCINASPDDILVEAQNLVSMLSRKRASYKFSWYQVGNCLYNIDYRLLNVWIKFSKTTTRKNFKPGECEQLWKKMKTTGYHLNTLHFFASTDNPESHAEYQEIKIGRLLKKGFDISNNSIARLLMEKFRYKFRCAHIKNNLWYEFKDHRWIKIDSAYTLRNKISEDLTQDYIKMQSALYDKARMNTGHKKDHYFKQAATISKIIKNLNTTAFKTSVIRECADLAFDSTFLDRLDENHNLLCFENGVYDLEADYFRPGCPDDYISLCTKYKYIELNDDDETVAEIYDFMKKIQPDKEMRKYLWILLSTCLCGSIAEEDFYVFTGSGANGKSKLMEIMRHALGDYYKPMNVLVITGKRTSASAATPEIANKKGIRICPLDEPRATDEIDCGFMKIFTGNDVIETRNLFSDPIYFKPQFKPFLLANVLPKIRSDDDGTWRRIKVIPFNTKFIKKSPELDSLELKEGTYWADINLSKKLPNWKEMFMALLVIYHRKYKKNGLIHPKLVTQETEDYRKRCDIYQDFISEYLMKSDDDQDYIKLSNIYSGMRSWFRTNCDGKCPSILELGDYLQHKITTYDKTKRILRRYKFIEKEELETEMRFA